MLPATRPGRDAVEACLKRVNGSQAATRVRFCLFEPFLVSYRPLGRQDCRISLLGSRWSPEPPELAGFYVDSVWISRCIYAAPAPDIARSNQDVVALPRPPGLREDGWERRGAAIACGCCAV